MKKFCLTCLLHLSTVEIMTLYFHEFFIGRFTAELLKADSWNFHLKWIFSLFYDYSKMNFPFYEHRKSAFIFGRRNKMSRRIFFDQISVLFQIIHGPFQRRNFPIKMKAQQHLKSPLSTKEQHFRFRCKKNIVAWFLTWIFWSFQRNLWHMVPASIVLPWDTSLVECLWPVEMTKKSICGPWANRTASW